MKPKKNPSARLEGKRGRFFAIGLVFALGITGVAFEWKTYELSANSLGELSLNDEAEVLRAATRAVQLLEGCMDRAAAAVTHHHQWDFQKPRNSSRGLRLFGSGQ